MKRIDNIFKNLYDINENNKVNEYDNINENKVKRNTTFSLEFFPPKTPKGIDSLNTKLHNFANENPLFIDLTWGAGGSTSDLTLDLSAKWVQQNYNVNMHITCSNMTSNNINNILNIAKKNNIQNLLVLRGDIQKDHTTINEFTSAIDLIKYINSHFPSDFCLGVSGYPEGHPDQIEEIKESDIQTLTKDELMRMSIVNNKYFVCRDDKFLSDLIYLKSKITEGGSYIISQLFFDSNLFIQFVNHCRSIGITCPIIPGIMLLQSYNGLCNMINLCKVKVSQQIIDDLTLLKDNPEKFIQYSINLTKNIISHLYNNNITHFHLYTLNQDTIASEIISFIKNLNN